MRALLHTARVRAAFPGADRGLLAAVLHLWKDVARPAARREAQSGETQDWNGSVSHAFFLATLELKRSAS